MGDCKITELKRTLYYLTGNAYGATWGTGICAGNVDNNLRAAAVITPKLTTKQPTVLYIWFAATIPGVLSILRTNTGGTYTEKLGGGANICTVANAVYYAKIPVESGDTIDFTYSAGSGTITTFIVRETGME
jgi:hypothetical protein